MKDLKKVLEELCQDYYTRLVGRNNAEQRTASNEIDRLVNILELLDDQSVMCKGVDIDFTNDRFTAILEIIEKENKTR